MIIKVKKCPDTASVSNICQYGASCIMDIRTNLAHCECDISCDVYEPKPICGSDGVSYDSLCHLKLAKCLQQRTIKIVSHDTCGKSIFKIIFPSKQITIKLSEKELCNKRTEFIYCIITFF